MTTLDSAALGAQLRVLASRPEDDAIARIARVAIADPAAASHLAIHELAARAQASDSSVVRVAKALGLNGYRQLRIALAELGGSSHKPGASSGLADIALTDPTAHVLAKLAAEEAESIRETAALLDDDALDRIAAAVASAGRIETVGVVASGLVAMDCVMKLARVGLHATAHTDGHSALQAAALVGPGDVMIGVSHSGTTDDVIGALQFAASRGATTAIITGYPHSPAAKIADHVLLTSTSRESAIRPGAMSSRTAQLFAIDALFVAVLQRLDPLMLNRLRDSFAAVRPLHRGITKGGTR